MRLVSIGVIALALVIPAASPALAKGGGGAASSPAGTSNSQPSSNTSNAAAASAAGATPAPAPFEEQMLAFDALDKISAHVAEQICAIGKAKAKAKEVVVLDQAALTALQAYSGFLQSAALITHTYDNIPDFADLANSSINAKNANAMMLDALSVGSTNPAGGATNAVTIGLSGDPIADLTGLISMMAVSSDIDAPGTITVPDGIIALRITNAIDTAEGCYVTATYPALDGSVAPDTTDIDNTLTNLDEARQTAHAAIMKYLTKLGAPGAGGAPPIATSVNALQTEIDALYDNFINTYVQANSSTGAVTMVQVAQGLRLSQLINGKYVLFATIVSAGGTQRDHKTFWTNIWAGDRISYSAGAIVNVGFWGDANKALYLDTLRYRSQLQESDAPDDNDAHAFDSNF